MRGNQTRRSVAPSFFGWNRALFNVAAPKLVRLHLQSQQDSGDTDLTQVRPIFGHFEQLCITT